MGKRQDQVGKMIIHYTEKYFMMKAAVPFSLHRSGSPELTFERQVNLQTQTAQHRWFQHELRKPSHHGNLSFTVSFVYGQFYCRIQRTCVSQALFIFTTVTIFINYLLPLVHIHQLNRTTLYNAHCCHVTIACRKRSLEIPQIQSFQRNCSIQGQFPGTLLPVSLFVCCFWNGNHPSFPGIVLFSPGVLVLTLQILRFSEFGHRQKFAILEISDILINYEHEPGRL